MTTTTRTQTTYEKTIKGERLTEHFSLKEMIQSGTAIRLNIDNSPSAEAIDNLQLLCTNVLEPLRRRFGVIRVTSGYRSLELNKAVGGSRTSQHMKGQAADIHVSSFEMGRKMMDFLCDNVTFDQALLEHSAKSGSRWLHVSYNVTGNRRYAVYDYQA